jgi:hypothetical protein
MFRAFNTAPSYNLVILCKQMSTDVIYIVRNIVYINIHIHVKPRRSTSDVIVLVLKRQVQLMT